MRREAEERDDAVLLRAVTRGDEGALAALYDRHTGWLTVRRSRRRRSWSMTRTLANPLRRRILSHLQQHREANSTSLARALGESTGTTSYHLRKLAEQGFVAEIEEKSGGPGAMGAGAAVPRAGAGPGEDGGGRVVSSR